MKIRQLFESKNVVLSFEVFPPKPVFPLDTVYDTLKELKDLKPDFISVTYGAGGSIKDNKTCELSSFIKDNYGIETLAHLTCINSTRENIELILKDLRNKGIENILALRGDVPKDGRIIGEYNSAYELIKQIKTIGGFGIGAACYPEGHVEHKDTYGDILELKRKVEKGAEHLISQLFFDNNIFYSFLEISEKENINIPIQAGIMPVVNKKQIERITSLCGATLPKKFIKIIDKYEYDKEALRDAGIAYAIEQIIDLISSGIQGIHLYTMNNAFVARKIAESLSSIISSLNKNIAI